MTIDYTNTMKNKGAYLDLHEVEAMLNYCESKQDTRSWMLIQTLLRTGRRITEIVGEKPYTKKIGLRPIDIRSDQLIEWDILKKNHIKTTNKNGTPKSPEALLRLQLNKTPQRKLKPVDQEYYEWITGYIQLNNIHQQRRVFPITSRRADQIIKHIAQKTNIQRTNMKIHCHMFRHTFAIHLLKNNPNDSATLRHVQELLDHSNIQMTMTYAQFTQQDKQEILNKTFGDY